ncbi:hypothetical protein quinque_006459 [Culex quinquefasciatus]
MEPAGEVVGLANELARAVKITLDPAASQQSRMDAYVACERFKEVSPLCAQAGLYLVMGNYPSIVRHFGLQLMEHTVKFNWNSISQQEKIFIKENAMKLLSTGVGEAQDQTVSHIKDGLSRVIVEMIKREWPQQWTTLLAELSDACSKGSAQTELVLLVFLRLVEDVALLQTIESNQRRKDIYQALTVNMSEIFDFFLRLIELHVGEFRNATAVGDKNKALGHSRVVQVVLLTLTGFVEWVSINHIMAANGRLLQILCILLIDVEFQQPAAECLLQIVNRKGQIKDRKPLLLLFDEAPVGHYYRAALQTELFGSEPYYQFLKKLIQVLNGLVTQLTGLWGKEDCQVSRQSFATFLETILTFTRHSSYTLSHSAALAWMALLKHEQIARDPLLLDYIPKIIELFGPKIIKLAYPTSRPTEITMHPQTFISLDYDGEEEWLVFFARCRTDFLEIFRQATLIAPLVAFSYSHKYPLLLLPIFDQINTSVTALIRQPDQLSNVEQVTLLEALLLISNHFCDYERQSTFVAEVTRDGVSLWMHLAPIIKNAHTFIDFVGLNKPPISPTSGIADPANINRGQIVYALNLILGVIKRCSWPDDPDRCSRGGFVVALTESGNPICRNPATSHVVPLLSHILSLMRVLNELWKPDAIAAIGEYFKSANGMQEHEKKQLLGISPALQDPLDPSVKKPPTALDRMQTFLSLIFEHCYHMMGSAGPSLGRDLYALPGIADAIIGSIFAFLDNVPDFRLRTIVRVFLKPFVYSCAPIFHEVVLLPIFAHFAPFMLTRLTARWQYITALYESGELGEDVNDTQEVLEDMLNRTLTREYIEVLKVALVGSTVDPTNSNASSEATMDTMDDQSMDGPPQALSRAAQSAMTSEVISDLGAKLLRNQYTCTPIVMTVLSVLSWTDSNSSLKATLLSGPVIRFLASEQLITDTLASNIIIAVLQGLQLHGQHEANQASLITLGVQAYEILRPKFPNILEVIQQIPNISAADIQKLDEKITLTATTKGNKIDKAKKDLFKKITSNIVGRSVGQHGKKEVRIVNLPPIAQVPRSACSNPMDNGQDTGLAHLFASRS